MNASWDYHSLKDKLLVFTLISLIAFSLFLGSSVVYGIGVFSKSEAPFGTPSDVWIGNWWSWWIKANSGGNAPVPNGCIINNTGVMVMLMETTVSGKQHQVCEISSTQGIMVPLWTAFMEDSISEQGNQPLKDYSYDQLSKAAREIGDLGAVTSLVKIDGKPVAKLDVMSSLKSGSLDYKINSVDNVTELYSKGFNITIPEDVNYPDQNPGTWRSGAHGWFVFLKPLPPGDHTLYYNVGVTGTGPNDHSAEITYDLKVK